MNVRVALAAAGVGATIRLLPDAADHDLLATIEVYVPRAGPTADPVSTLAPALATRRTVRSAFAPAVVAPAPLLRLIETAVTEGVEPRFVASPGQRGGVTHWTAAGQRLQEVDPAFRAELLRWTRPNSTANGDGIVPAAVGRDAAQSRSAPIPQRDFAGGSVTSPAWSPAEETHAALLALATARDDDRHWLTAGLGLEAVLLTAELHGLTASFLDRACRRKA